MVDRGVGARADYVPGFQPSGVVGTSPGPSAQAGMYRAFGARSHRPSIGAWVSTVIWQQQGQGKATAKARRNAVVLRFAENDTIFGWTLTVDAPGAGAD